MIVNDLLKKAWRWILNQTNLDETIQPGANELVKEYKETKAKLNEVKEEVKHRTKRVKEEVKDVINAAYKVKSQIDDIKAADKGQKRKGRKPAAKKPRANKNP